MTEIKLEINAEYEIELYPESSTIKARYIGETKLTHDFVYKDEIDTGIIVMNKRWIEEKTEGKRSILTYNQFSSSSVVKIPANEIEKGSSLTKFLVAEAPNN